MANRQSINLPGAPMHSQPFPAASRAGNIIYSSAIPGKDPESGKVPDDAADQIRNVFINMKALVEAGGGTVDDIVKVQVFMEDRSKRDLVNTEWVVMFPDEDSRPVRHTIAGPLPSNYIIQMEFIAVI